VFKDLTVKELPKAFKGMLADYFSLRTSQERPVVPIPGTQLFPVKYGRKIRQATGTLKKRIGTLWDLMQCKVLAKEVDSSFVKDTLIKHRETVSKVCKTDPKLIEEFQEFIKPWVAGVGESLKNNPRTKLATTHACLESNRGRGGVRSVLRIEDSELIQPTEPRIDPITISIHGKPGAGKSLIQSRIAKLLAEKLEASYTDTVYCRNSQCDHWDGYNNQPLVIIDDFCQSTINYIETGDRSIGEFITLNSTTDYITPMAKLEDKGKKFTSPLIVYSSNLSTSCVSAILGKTVQTPDAILRRWDISVDIDNLTAYTLYKEGEIQKLKRKVIHRFNNISEIAPWIVSQQLQLWRDKSVFYQSIFEDHIYQPISTSGQYFYKFKTTEPSSNEVKVSAILEPLKVRTVTVGTADNWVLKPLQSAMLDALRAFPSMKPCFTPEYTDEVQCLFEKEGLILSGDYSSATDGLHSDIFRAGVETLASVCDPALFKIVQREAGVHTVTYPKKYGIEDAYQTNGQLMGSLLSFPFLCLVNAFTVHKATGKSLKDIPALIHGDDLLGKMTQQEYDLWKHICPQIGLGLSIGKNYVSRSWGSIDSQVYLYTDKKVVRLGTGKYKCYLPRAEQMVTTLLKKGLDKGLVVGLMNRTGYSRLTPRSIDVDVKFGGLDPHGLEPQTAQDRLIYALQVRSQSSKKKVGDLVEYTIPEMCHDLVPDLIIDTEEKNVEQKVSTNFTLWKSLRRLEKAGVVDAHSILEVPYSRVVTKLNPFLENIVTQSKDFVAVLQKKDSPNYFM